jgi:hypothetical protein
MRLRGRQRRIQRHGRRREATPRHQAPVGPSPSLVRKAIGDARAATGGVPVAATFLARFPTATPFLCLPLSEMRRAEKKTRLRAEWTSGGITEKFFDYVPKGTKKAER